MTDMTPSGQPQPPAASDDTPQFSQQIENALREGGRQINFDDIEKRYRGKRVWVLDRQKMQEGVMRVVDAAILKSQQEAEGGIRTRRRVAQALSNLFGNNRNLTSPVDASKVMARQAPSASPAAGSAGAVGGASGGGGVSGGAALDLQIDRLARVIDQAEGMLTRMSYAAARGGGVTGRDYQARRMSQRRQEHDKVLQEIFKNNLELHRGISGQADAGERQT